MSKDKEYAEALSGPKNSLAYDTWRRLISNKAAVFGMAFMIFLILLAIFADFLFDYQTEVIVEELCKWNYGSSEIMQQKMPKQETMTQAHIRKAQGAFLLAHRMANQTAMAVVK